MRLFIVALWSDARITPSLIFIPIVVVPVLRVSSVVIVNLLTCEKRHTSSTVLGLLKVADVYKVICHSFRKRRDVVIARPQCCPEVS